MERVSLLEFERFSVERPAKGVHDAPEKGLPDPRRRGDASCDNAIARPNPRGITQGD
jgi:hypothetical protein